MKNLPAHFADPMSPEWRTNAAIAALERRRWVRSIVLVVMVHVSVLAGLLCTVMPALAREFLFSMSVTAAVSCGWQIGCIIRANLRLARLREDLRR